MNQNLKRMSGGQEVEAVRRGEMEKNKEKDYLWKWTNKITIMKLNLPSTWTQQKISSLFFLTLLHSLKKTEAGTQLSACLGTSAYNATVTFASTIPNKERFCCNIAYPACVVSPSTCPINDPGGYAENYGQCYIVGQSKFCVASGYSANGLPGNLCGGILGNSIPINATVGTCPNFDAIGNVLSSQSTTPTFSWLCCDSVNCLVPANVAVTNNVVNTNCSVGQYSLMCFNDNGGWTCTGSVGTTISDITQPIGDCVIQVVPNSNSVTSSLSSSSSLTSSTNPLISSISNLVNSYFSDSSSTKTTSTATVEIPVVTVYSTDSGSSNNNTPPNLNIILPVVVGGPVMIVTATGCYIWYKKHKKWMEQQNKLKRENFESKNSNELKREKQENFESKNSNGDQNNVLQRQNESLQTRLARMEGYLFANAQNQFRRENNNDDITEARIEELPPLPPF